MKKNILIVGIWMLFGAHTMKAAASSSSTTPIAGTKKVRIVDEAGINALADTYKDPIPVSGASGL